MAIQIRMNDEQSIIHVSPDMYRLIEDCLRCAAQLEEVTTGEVSVTIVDDQTIHKLNHMYRKVDHPTDVLSFPLEDDLPLPEEAGIAPLLGDIVISAPRVAAQAKEFGHSLEREFGFLVTHGFLHLLGYDHDTEAAEARMVRRQEEVLRSLGIER